ncbi:MAG: ABC transporter permease subunit [Candidatus Methylomirabilia bacterium]
MLRFPTLSWHAVTLERLIGYALLLPAFLLVFGLLIYPLFYDLWLSVTDVVNVEGSRSFVGLRHYQYLFGDLEFWHAARNTVFLVALTTLVELVVGILTALLLWWRFWGRAFIFLSVFVPWAFPVAFSAFAWYWLLSPPFPTFYTLNILETRWWLEGVFGPGAWQVLSIAIMNVWRGSSIIAVFLLAGFNAIPEELLEVGKIEARTSWQYFWRVVVPLSRRFLVLALVVGVVITYIEYASMYVSTGGRITVPVMGTLAFREGIQNGNTGLGAALALIPIPFAIALVLYSLRLLEGRAAHRRMFLPARVLSPYRRLVEALARRRATRSAARQDVAVRTARRRLWPVRRVALLGAGLSAALAVMVFHLFPVYYTAVQAFRSLPEYALGNPFWVYDPTFEDFLAVIRNSTFWHWGWNTLVIFGAVLVVSLTISLLAGYALARLDLPGSLWLARLMFFSYFIPQMAVIMPVFQLFLLLNLDDTIVGIVLLYLTLAIPFAAWLFYLYFQGLPREVEEHALLDGSRVQVFLRIVFPMSWPVMIAAGLFAVGMMGSDILYAATFALSDATKTLPAGLGLTAMELDEWGAPASAAVLLSSLPIIIACAALSPYYVRGLRAALIEGA